MMRRGKRRSGIVRKRREVLRIVNCIIDTIREHYLENEAGVYIQGMGYMCHMQTARRNFTKMGNGRIKRENYNGVVYHHGCLDFLRADKSYIHFHMLEKVRVDSTNLMHHGRRYRFLYREVKEKMKKIDKAMKIPGVFNDKPIPYLSYNC